MILSILLAASLGAAGGLPPGHPPVDGQPLPPGHPAMNGEPLPPGHPAIDGESLPADPPAIRAAAPAADASQLPPGHPAIAPGKQPPSAEELLKQLDAQPDLERKDKPFDVAVALGKLYYANARYPRAEIFFNQALVKAQPLRDFYLQQLHRSGRKPLPSAQAAGCVAASEAEVKALEQKARAKAANDPAAAATCAREALRVVLDAQTLLANAYFLSGDPDKALREHEKVLAVDPTSAESLYDHAGILLDSRGDQVASLKGARGELTKFLELYPLQPKADEARKLLARVDEAIGAGGLTALNRRRAAQEKAQLASAAAAPASEPEAPSAPFAQAGGPMMQGGAMQGGPMGGGDSAAPPLTREMVDAVQNTEMTPEVLAGLQKLVEQGEQELVHHRYQAALDDYKRVVPFQPQNGRAKAGMAWALEGLQKPMADRVWMVAVESDPKAVESLGDSLAQQGDADSAKALWRKLAETAPDYAQQSGLNAKLK